jgi:LysM repeat protein
MKDRSDQRGRAWRAALLVVGAAGLFAACGTTDEASRQTLPPLETTTTTTTTTTTIPIERFYTVQRGDILAVIAADRGVTVEAIVDLNELASADAIQAGQVLEIPANVRD